MGGSLFLQQKLKESSKPSKGVEILHTKHCSDFEEKSKDIAYHLIFFVYKKVHDDNFLSVV